MRKFLVIDGWGAPGAPGMVHMVTAPDPVEAVRIQFPDHIKGMELRLHDHTNIAAPQNFTVQTMEDSSAVCVLVVPVEPVVLDAPAAPEVIIPKQ